MSAGRTAVLALMLLMVFSALMPSCSASAAGPMEIDSYGDLCRIGVDLPSDGDYIQTSDIIIPSDAPSRKSIAGELTGTYDGRGHSIVFPESSVAGLFSGLNGASVFDLRLTGTVNTVGTYDSPDIAVHPSIVGALAPDAADSRIVRVSFSGDVSASVRTESSSAGKLTEDRSSVCTAGGLVGRSSGCEYLACSVKGTVSSAETLNWTSDSPDCRLNSVIRTGLTAGGIIGTSFNDSMVLCSTECTFRTGSEISLTLPEASGSRIVTETEHVIGGLCAEGEDTRTAGCTVRNLSEQTYSHSLSAGSVPATSSSRTAEGGLIGIADGCLADSCRVSSQMTENESADAPDDREHIGGLFGESRGSAACFCLMDGAFLCNRLGTGHTAQEVSFDGTICMESSYSGGSDDGILLMPDSARGNEEEFSVLLSHGLWTWDADIGDAVPDRTYRTVLDLRGETEGRMSLSLPENGRVSVDTRVLEFRNAFGNDAVFGSEGCDWEVTDEGMRITPVFDWSLMSFGTAVITADHTPDRTPYIISGVIFGAVCTFAGAALVMNVRSLLLL